MAERKGFEPLRPLKVYTLSKRAPSTTRPPLRFLVNYNLLLLKNYINVSEIVSKTFCGVIFFISSLDFKKVSPTFLIVVLIGSI